MKEFQPHQLEIPLSEKAILEIGDQVEKMFTRYVEYLKDPQAIMSAPVRDPDYLLIEVYPKVIQERISDITNSGYIAFSCYIVERMHEIQKGVKEEEKDG